MRTIVAVGILACVGFRAFDAPAQAWSPPLKSITIDDELISLPGGELKKYVQIFVITPSGGDFVRLTSEGVSDPAVAPKLYASSRPQNVDSGLVYGFLNVVEAWRFPSPSAEALAMTPVQRRTLETDLVGQCKYQRGGAAALAAYYSQESLWTDDYPNLEVTVEYGNGRKLQITSRNQQLFGLPWRRLLGRGKESLSFDSEISRALLPLLDAEAVNGDRLNGDVPFGPDTYAEVASAACNARLPQAQRS